jgi:hypothetical protein
MLKFMYGVSVAVTQLCAEIPEVLDFHRCVLSGTVQDYIYTDHDTKAVSYYVQFDYCAYGSGVKTWIPETCLQLIPDEVMPWDQ